MGKENSHFKLLNTESRRKAIQLQYDFYMLDYRKIAVLFVVCVSVFAFIFCVLDECNFVTAVLLGNFICLLGSFWLALRKIRHFTI